MIEIDSQNSFCKKLNDPGMMKRVLLFAAVSEAATGLVLLIVPALVGRLLFGGELTGIAIPVARVAGIGLFSLGLACWPGKKATRTASLAMLTYNLLVALYFLVLGLHGEWVGVLLWPAAGLHGVITILLAGARPWDSRGA
jgi:hypothetical protein